MARRFLQRFPWRGWMQTQATKALCLEAAETRQLGWETCEGLESIPELDKVQTIK